MSDNWKHFTSKLFLDVCRILHVQNSFTTTHHPQTNVQVEIFNRAILPALRAYINAHTRDLDLYTSVLTYAYNTQHQKSTSVTPFDLVLSKPPGPIAASLPQTEYKGPPDYKQKLNKWFSKVISETQEMLKRPKKIEARNVYKLLRKYKKKIRPGDNFFLQIERKDQKETHHKLAPITEGLLVQHVNNFAETVIIKRLD